jgi:hypothetical protein
MMPGLKVRGLRPRIEILGWRPLSLRDGWQTLSAIGEDRLGTFASSSGLLSRPEGTRVSSPGFQPWVGFPP